MENDKKGKLTKSELLSQSDAIKDEDIDYSDIPELTDEDFKRARPFKEVHPELYESWKKNGATLVIKKAESDDL
ncbi:hypothetical protein CBA19CS22_39595 [Caballeronia novacaledonica]|uniref:Uncharacterized protein n=1 Tax=Caballeronia novacaledonica TaxID=1544861 RepID=A0ACB5R675_9BURK|nr:hypothetical protein CBA19CS22_39595 [Caballeronia novacaledonica]